MCWIRDVFNEMNEFVKVLVFGNSVGQHLGKLDFYHRLQSRNKARSAYKYLAWRTFEPGGDWTVEYREKLLRDISKERECGEHLPRILLWGPVGSGKSSFFNSIASIDKGHFVNVTNAGRSPHDKSMTHKLFILHLNNRITNFYMMDVMGLEGGNLQGLHDDDVKFLMEGKIEKNYPFNEKHPIETNSEHFHAEPSLAEKAHCNVLIISAHDVDTGSLSDMLMTKLHKVKDHANNENVATILVLTKIDDVCEDVAGKIRKTYSSEKIEGVVKKASEQFGIPEMNIFPVKNYSKEVEMKIEMDILLLLAVRHMVRYASHSLSRMSHVK